MTWAEVAALGRHFPGVEEAISYGTPALRSNTKFLTRLRDEYDSLVLACPFDERELLLEAAPEVFHLTPHYQGDPWILSRMAAISPVELERRWRATARKRDVLACEAAR